MICQDAERIREALQQVAGVKGVTRVWPTSLEALPCVAISKASDTTADYRDDRAYLKEVEYYVRIFSSTASEGDAIAPGIDAQMEGLGYTLVFACDEDDGETRVQAMRYRRYV